jgi:hypothetical protein
MPQIQLPGLDQVFMDSLRAVPGAGQPGGNGPFIQPIGGDNGGHRATMGQQDQDERHQLSRRSQAVGRGASSGGEGTTTAFTLIALVLATMNANGALPHLPSCVAGRIVTELGLRVQRGDPPEQMR